VLSERLKTYFFVPLPVYIVADPSLEGLAASRIEFEKMSEEVRRHKRTEIAHEQNPLSFLSAPSRDEALPDIDIDAKPLSRLSAQSVFEGWLCKKKSTKEVWALKFCVLTPSSLSYYNPRLKSTFTLAKNSFELLDSAISPDSWRHFELFGLLIHFNKSKVSCGFRSLEERREWMNVLSEISDPSLRYEGWCWIKEFRTWKLRFMISYRKNVWIFDMDLKWSIPLHSAEGPASISFSKLKEPTMKRRTAKEGIKTSSTFPYRFSLSASDGVYLFAVDVEDRLIIWIRKIQEAIELQYEDEEQLDFSSFMKPPSGIVSFVFTDIQNSTFIWESCPSAMSEALQMHDKVLRENIRKYSGYEVKTEGDAFVVAFQTSLDALAWCVSVQLDLLNVHWPDDVLAVEPPIEVKGDVGEWIQLFIGPRVRMGIHQGKSSCKRNPVTYRMDYFGPEVSIASHVSSSAYGGQIMVSDSVKDAVSREDWKAKFPALDYPMLKYLGKINPEDAGQVKLWQAVIPRLRRRCSFFKVARTGVLLEDEPG